MITLYWADRLWTHGGKIQRTDAKITNWRARPEGVWTDGEDFVGLGRWIASAVPALNKEQHGAFALAKINGGRCIANVEVVTALGLDGDTTGITTREAFDLLEGYERIVYTTHSSTPTAQRWRAIIALSRIATGAEHYRYVGLAHANLRDAGVPLDAAAVDPCRLWYLPSFRSRENYECYVGHGVPLDVDVALATVDELDAEREAERAGRARTQSTRLLGRAGSLVARASAYVAKMEPAISGSGGHTATFLVARRLVQDFGLSDADALAIMRDYNARCQPPWAEQDLKRKVSEARHKARVSISMEQQ